MPLLARGWVYMMGHNDIRPSASSDAPEVSFTPRLMESLKSKHLVTRVGCTEGCSVAITHQGKVFTWGGSPFFGSLGQPEEFEPSRSITVPTCVKAMKVCKALF